MYRRTAELAIALIIAVIFCSIGLNGSLQSAYAAAAAKPVPTKAPEGYVIVEEDVLTYFVDSPGEHFHEARENFLKKDFKGAASEIRKSEAFLKLQAARATEEGKKGLIASIAELEKLANGVEKGAITSAKTLDNAFARAHHALARHHYLKALEYVKGGAKPRRVCRRREPAALPRNFCENGRSFAVE